METKGLLIDLAKQFFNEPSVEKCEEKFNKLMSNKIIHHITTNSIASINGRDIVMTMPDAKPEPKVKPKINKKEQQYEMDKLKVRSLSKQLKTLKLHYKIMQSPVTSNHYDNDSYFAIRQAILNSGSKEALNDPESLCIKTVPSSENTIIETTLPNRKTARFTIPNYSLEVIQDNAIQSYITKTEREIASLTAKIADYEQHQGLG